MASKLMLRQYIDLPFHPEGDFDHGDVWLSNGSVFIANTAAGTVEVVDGENLRHLATIPGCAEASGVVAVLSASTFELVGQFPVSGVGPHGLDLDQEGHRVFIACDGGSVVTLENSTGSELAKVSIAGAPDAIWHNHQTSHLYVAIEDPGVIDVLNTQTMVVDEQISTEVGVHTTAYDARRQRLYVFLPSCRTAVYEESEVP